MIVLWSFIYLLQTLWTRIQQYCLLPFPDSENLHWTEKQLVLRIWNNFLAHYDNVDQNESPNFCPHHWFVDAFVAFWEELQLSALKCSYCRKIRFYFNSRISRPQSTLFRRYFPYSVLALFSNIWESFSTHVRMIACCLIFSVPFPNAIPGRCWLSVLFSRVFV